MCDIGPTVHHGVRLAPNLKEILSSRGFTLREDLPRPIIMQGDKVIAAIEDVAAFTRLLTGGKND